MARQGGIVNTLMEAIEQRTGRTLVEGDRLTALEEAAQTGWAARRELDLLGYTVMNYLADQPQEVRFDQRRTMAQQSRIVWMQDPQAGAAVDLANDFVFGRGMPKPKCADEKVQEVVDEAWEDPDNQLVLTSYEAQIALNTDLELQSNVFLVMFDEGEDGKVKLGLLDHDTVEDVVRDPDNRLRVLYYLTRQRKRGWDFKLDRPALPDLGANTVLPQVHYYPHWRNVEEAEADEGRDEPVPVPPAEKLAEGKVRHVAVNRTSEMAFGVPTMRRTIRWFTAYNDFMKARVDMAQAAAAFIMKRTVKGTPSQLAKMAAKAVSRQGAGDMPDGPLGRGPSPAAVINENEAVTHDNIKLDSGAGNAETDGQMIRSQISAATHFPQHYLGDAGSANLATATSMELPVLKHIEGRQEVWEGVVRWFVDRVIEKAREDGRLDDYLAPEEEEVDGELLDDTAQKQLPMKAGVDYAPDLGSPAGAPMQQANDPATDPNQAGPADGSPMDLGGDPTAQIDDGPQERDFTYEFSMPNPLKRAITDLTTAIQGVAQTFDPNNTNTELSRVLLAIALGDVFEVEDPQKLVERIFPPDYEDPMMKMQQQQMQMMQNNPGMMAGPPGAQGADGQQHGGGNPYGAPMQASLPGQGPMQQALVEAMFDAQFEAFPVAQRWLDWADTLAEDDPWREVVEARLRDLPEGVQLRTRSRMTDVARMFDADVKAIADEALTGLAVSGNGNGDGHH